MEMCTACLLAGIEHERVDGRQRGSLRVLWMICDCGRRQCFGATTSLCRAASRASCALADRHRDACTMPRNRAAARRGRWYGCAASNHSQTHRRSEPSCLPTTVFRVALLTFHVSNGWWPLEGLDIQRCGAWWGSACAGRASLAYSAASGAITGATKPCACLPTSLAPLGGYLYAGRAMTTMMASPSDHVDALAKSLAAAILRSMDDGLAEADGAGGAPPLPARADATFTPPARTGAAKREQLSRLLSALIGSVAGVVAQEMSTVGVRGLGCRVGHRACCAATIACRVSQCQRLRG